MKYLFFEIVSALLLFGCLGSGIASDVAKTLPVIQGFLHDYPHAEIAEKLLGKAAVEADSDFLSNCLGVLVPADGLSKVTFTDSSSGLKAFAFIDSNNKVSCAYKNSNSIPTPSTSSITTPSPSPSVSSTPSPSPSVSPTPYPSPSPKATSTPSTSPTPMPGNGMGLIQVYDGENNQSLAGVLVEMGAADYLNRSKFLNGVEINDTTNSNGDVQLDLSLLNSLLPPLTFPNPIPYNILISASKNGYISHTLGLGYQESGYRRIYLIRSYVPVNSESLAIKKATSLPVIQEWASIVGTYSASAKLNDFVPAWDVQLINITRKNANLFTYPTSASIDPYNRLQKTVNAYKIDIGRLFKVLTYSSQQLDIQDLEGDANYTCVPGNSVRDFCNSHPPLIPGNVYSVYGSSSSGDNPVSVNVQLHPIENVLTPRPDNVCSFECKIVYPPK